MTGRHFYGKDSLGLPNGGELLWGHGAFKPPGCDRTGETELRDSDGPTAMQLCFRLSGGLFHARLSAQRRRLHRPPMLSHFLAFAASSWNASSVRTPENIAGYRVWAGILNQVCKQTLFWIHLLGMELLEQKIVLWLEHCLFLSCNKKSWNICFQLL